ncbi:MAG TPA: non-heme iron oxygenase ferredoxin subunit [Ktedonobacterales bacterium]|nr:non-heme iron oxygenase ferredoxin subunit [Ktedonobacterales bacterium]
MTEFVRVASVGDVAPGSSLCVEVGDEPVALFNCGGEIFAIGDTCTHAESSLSEGELLDGCIVECAMHGAQFDVRTGKVLCLPATIDADRYAVRIEGDAIMVSRDPVASE